MSARVLAVVVALLAAGCGSSQHPSRAQIRARQAKAAAAAAAAHVAARTASAESGTATCIDLINLTEGDPGPTANQLDQFETYWTQQDGNPPSGSTWADYFNTQCDAYAAGLANTENLADLASGQ